ncbi:MAG: hypothetical protein FWD38_06625 [Oscillospiraceae bacterium]|nr:hypothetical protein [Oscillospiraceae bacterium]
MLYNTNIMKKHNLRVISILLIVMMSLSLFVACKNGDDDADTISKDDDYVYIPEFISLPDYIGRISNPVYTHEKLYFSSIIMVDELIVYI